MKEIYDKILEYDDDGELWYFYGERETANLIASKSIINWNDVIDQIMSHGSLMVTRFLEAVSCIENDSIANLISALVPICSDENLEDIFFMINDQLASKLNPEDLQIILMRTEKIYTNRPKNEGFMNTINCINRYLAEK